MNFEEFKSLRAEMNFLNNHPAVNSCFGGSFFVDNLSFGPDAYCKNGVLLDDNQPQDVTVRIKSTHPRFDEWSKLFPDEVDIINDIRGNELSKHMRVPYETVYGYPWEYAITKYSGSFSVYRASGEQKNADVMPYEAVSYMVSDTFESLVHDMAAWVEMNFGNFDEEDFLTPEEKENHFETEAFLFTEGADGEGNKIFTMTINPDNIYVPWQSINLRWWKWFEETDLYRRDYQGLFVQE